MHIFSVFFLLGINFLDSVAARIGDFIGTHEIAVIVLIDVFVVIVCSRLLGLACKKIKQPLVVGEIIAGIILGQSFLGLIAPDLAALLFPAEVIPFLNVLAQIGLIFFMFLIGLELNPKYLSGHLDTAILISHVSILSPFALGAVGALVLYPTVGIAGVDFTAFALFLGAAMSITAFPVLARIITEKNLQDTSLGTLALTCAAVDDVTAWCLLAVSIAVARSGNFQEAIPTLISAAGYIAVMLIVARKVLKKTLVYYKHREYLSRSELALIYGMLIISAIATELIGIHFIFGAFMLGAVMPKDINFVREIAEKTEDFVTIFLLPLFFAYSGLRTQIGLLNTPFLWALCFGVIVIAVAGKYVGTYVAARFNGVSKEQSAALGWLMNTRGLTELIVLNIGLNLGVISPELFAMLVIMALVTTFMTSPLLEIVYPKELVIMDKMYADLKNRPTPILTGVTTETELLNKLDD